MTGGNQYPQGGHRPNHNPGNAHHGRFCGRGRGQAARAHGNGCGGQDCAANAGPAIADEANERGRVHAAIDNPEGHN